MTTKYRTLISQSHSHIQYLKRDIIEYKTCRMRKHQDQQYATCQQCFLFKQGATLTRFRLESCINFFLWHQRVPLGHWTSGISQHIWPVPQADSCGSITHEGLSDGVVASEFVVVKHCDDDLHFLWENKEWRGVSCLPRSGPVAVAQPDRWYEDTAYLYLLKGDVKAETLIEVRIEGVFLYGGLFLLYPFPILLQNNLHVRIFGKKERLWR